MRNRIAIALVMLPIGCGTTAAQSRQSAGGSMMKAEEALEERGSRELVLSFYHDLNQRPRDLSRAD
jgi:hypothetical protein